MNHPKPTTTPSPDSTPGFYGADSQKELNRLISSMLDHQKLIDFGHTGWEKHIDGLIKDRDAITALFTPPTPTVGVDNPHACSKHQDQPTGQRGCVDCVVHPAPPIDTTQPVCVCGKYAAFHKNYTGGCPETNCPAFRPLDTYGELSDGTEYAPYPQCYDVSNDAERPKHNNWIIPSGTTVLVDFDSVVKARLAEYEEQHAKSTDTN